MTKRAPSCRAPSVAAPPKTETSSACRAPGAAGRLEVHVRRAQPGRGFQQRFQRLDGWLDSNAHGGIRVPIFFADYETSVYGRRSMQLSPLEDLQRFLRYGYAHSTCLIGLTLSYRELHKEHYPAEAPVLTHEDVVGFVEHEAACVGMACTLLECYRVRGRPSYFALPSRVPARSVVASHRLRRLEAA